MFQDGEVELATEVQYSGGATSIIGGLADHIRLSLNEILQAVFPNADLVQSATGLKNQCFGRRIRCAPHAPDGQL